MPRRVLDWLRQAERNLRSARVNMNAGIYEEACFESHQAAEKALKALLQAFGVERRGHALLYLYKELEKHARVRGSGELLECLAFLDKQYIPTRYPDVYAEGAPGDYYTRGEAGECIRCAELVIRWVREALREVLEGEA